MSKVKIKGNASGTGVLTIEAPNTDTDRTITLPDEDITLGGGVDGIVSTANATAITIDSSEQVTISNSNSADNTLTIEALNDNGNEANVKLAGDISGAGMGSGEVAGSIQYFNNTDHIASISGMRDGSDEGQLSFKTRDTSDSAPVERLIIKKDGRGLSQFTAKAWVSFIGTTMTVLDSHNVSSVTNPSTGQHYVNFANNMANNDYAVVTNGNRANDQYIGTHYNWHSTSNVRLYTYNMNGTTPTNSDTVAVLVFGD